MRGSRRDLFANPKPRRRRHLNKLHVPEWRLFDCSHQENALDCSDVWEMNKEIKKVAQAEDVLDPAKSTALW